MRISIIGLGKLGAPMAAVYASKGHQVLGLDLDEEVVRLVNLGLPPVKEPGLQELMRDHRFKATTSYEELVRASDVTYIIVPTPSDPDGKFTNDYVIEAITALGRALQKKKKYHLTVVCSTTMPGSVGGPIAKALEEASGSTIGDTLGLAYSPEFIALGSVIKDMLHPDMVLIGESDSIAGTKLEKITRTIVDAPIKRMSLVNAEIAKIAVNTYITMKISYANTLAEVCEGIPGGDAYTVADAIGLDSRIGRRYLTPGTGFGGPCFPRDTVAFAAMAEEIGFGAPLALATDVVNERQTERLVGMAVRMCRPKSTIAILGASYKPKTAVVDKSPGLALAAELQKKGFFVRVSDPIAKPTSDIPIHKDPIDTLKGAALGFIMTPSDEYKKIVPSCFVNNPSLVLVDCWDITESGPWDDVHIMRLGKSML